MGQQDYVTDSLSTQPDGRRMLLTGRTLLVFATKDDSARRVVIKKEVVGSILLSSSTSPSVFLQSAIDRYTRGCYCSSKSSLLTIYDIRPESFNVHGCLRWWVTSYFESSFTKNIHALSPFTCSKTMTALSMTNDSS